MDEFRSAGFGEATLLRTMRNARTKNPHVLVAEVRARRIQHRPGRALLARSEPS